MASTIFRVRLIGELLETFSEVKYLISKSFWFSYFSDEIQEKLTKTNELKQRDSVAEKQRQDDQF